MDRRHLTAAAACAGVLALALDGGGYERSAWGWAGLAAWALVLVALVRGERLTAGHAALVFGVGLLAVLGWTLATAAWSQSLPSSVA